MTASGGVVAVPSCSRASFMAWARRNGRGKGAGSLDRLDPVPVRLGVAHGLERDLLADRVLERRLVRTGDGEALFLELVHELALVFRDLRGGARGGFLRHVGEDLLV